MQTRRRVPARTKKRAMHAASRDARRRRLALGELASLLRLAGPIIVSQLGQVGMNTADTIMVGPLGATPLASAGLGSAIHMFVTVLCIGIIVGMAPLVSQAFGAGDTARCRRVLVQGVWLAVLLSVPVTLSSLIGEPIALALGQDAAVAALTGEYMWALAWGVGPLFAFMAMRQYLEGMGRPAPAMVITFIGLAVNIAANRLLIYGVDGVIPMLGVAGSGWATTIVRWTMLAAMAIYIALRPRLRIGAEVGLAPDRGLLARIAAIGAPVGAQFGLEVGLFSFAAIMMGWLGPLQLAAHQVTINVASTTFMVALGVSLAGSIRVGQRIGGHRPRAMRRAILCTYALAIGFMAMCALLFVAFPGAIIRLYTPDPEIVGLGVTLLLVAAAFQVFDGAQVAGMCVLRGVGDTRVPMVIAGASYWGIGAPVGWLLAFPLGLGPPGIWIGLSVGLATAAAALFLRVRHSFWRRAVPALGSVAGR
jgi:MATE family multidrug resistance protein